MENPLRDADRREINAALFKLSEVQSLIDALDKLGHDTTELVLRAEYLKGKLQTLKQAFFPDAP